MFDTETQESVMRFATRADAVDLVVELVIAESREQLQAWQSPAARREFYLIR